MSEEIKTNATMEEMDPAVALARESEITRLMETYKMSVNNKKRRTLMSMTDKLFQSYELGLIVSRCCRVSLI
jgi:hypothetical protein